MKHILYQSVKLGVIVNYAVFRPNATWIIHMTRLVSRKSTAADIHAHATDIWTLNTNNNGWEDNNHPAPGVCTITHLLVLRQDKRGAAVEESEREGQAPGKFWENSAAEHSPDWSELHSGKKNFTSLFACYLADRRDDELRLFTRQHHLMLLFWRPSDPFIACRSQRNLFVLGSHADVVYWSRHD